MKEYTAQIVENLFTRYPDLIGQKENMLNALTGLIKTYRNGGKLLVCGNGGSAADAEHIVGELMKGFLLPRPLSDKLKEKLAANFPVTADYLSNNLQMALPAVSLVGQTALNTAFANDQAPDLTFAQQVLGLGLPDDTLLAISTSGNSANVLYAVQIAQVKGMFTIGLTGKTGGKLANLADITIISPAAETYLIQEHHLPIYHTLCAALEHEFFTA